MLVLSGKRRVDSGHNLFKIVRWRTIQMLGTQMTSADQTQPLRNCLRDPIREIFDAAKFLDDAVSAHNAGEHKLAADLIRLADMPKIRGWSESIWGKGSPYVKVRHVAGAPPSLDKNHRVKVRMPNSEEKAFLHRRDGYHCRFCGIPVIRKEIRKAIHSVYPDALSWGRTHPTQHAAFQAMWVQYDHLVPHSRGGNNELCNIVITCAPCNYGRWHRLVEEVGLIDPRSRAPITSAWDGLERFHKL